MGLTSPLLRELLRDPKNREKYDAFTRNPAEESVELALDCGRYREIYLVEKLGKVASRGR